LVIPVVTSGSIMCQNVSVRRTRDEVSFTYTYATVGPDENETASEAMWAMFQQKRKEAAWPSGVVFILIIFFIIFMIASLLKT